MPPTRRARVRSLAKINLDLRVLNRRPDGYHELRTIFQTVSLADSIHIEFTPGPITTIHLESKIDIPNNLILQAAELVMAASHATGSLHFRLQKRIPMGGGLGGGSSNAAAVLLALPVLTGHPLPVEALIDLGAQLGSDVPFFLFGGTALGLGRGTELYPALEPSPRPALLVTPGVHVSTPEAYRALNRELTSEPPSATLRSFQSIDWRSDPQAPDQGINWDVINDFETVVFNQHPQLKSIKENLLALGARPALMSGSGSTLFGIFESMEARNAADARLTQELGRAKVHPVTLVNRCSYRRLWEQSLKNHTEEPHTEQLPTQDVWPPRSRYTT